MSTGAKFSNLPIVILFFLLFVLCFLEFVSAVDRTPVMRRGPDTDRSAFVDRR